MTKLSNSNLLDENVSTNLKSERLQKTAQVAQNPNLMEHSNINNMSNVEGQQIQMPPQMQQPIVDPMKSYQNTGKIERNSSDDDDNISHNLPNKNYGDNGKKEKSDDGKILGMPKGLAIALGLVIVGVGGYLLYKKFSKVGAKGKSSNTSATDVASNTSNAVSESVKSMDLTP